jgi:hypothetical protein
MRPSSTPLIRSAAADVNRVIDASLADPKTRARFADLGATTLAGPPADFGKLIADETEKWRKVIRVSNIKAG